MSRTDVQIEKARVGVIGLCEFQGRAYHPVDPMCDCESVIGLDRVILVHARGGEPVLSWQLAGTLWSGWVVGVAQSGDYCAEFRS